MDLAVMTAAQRYGEFVTDLAPESGVLREAKVVGIRWLAPADQAGLLGDEFDVRLVPNSAWFGKGQFSFVDRRLARLSGSGGPGREPIGWGWQ